MDNNKIKDMLLTKSKWLRSCSEKQIALPLNILEPLLKDDNIYLKGNAFSENYEFQKYSHNTNLIIKKAIPNQKFYQYYIFMNLEKSNYNQLYYFAYALAKIYYDQLVEKQNYKDPKYQFEPFANADNCNDERFIKFSDDLLAPQYLIKNIKIYFKRYENYKPSQINKYLLSNVLSVPIAVIIRQENR